MNIIHGTWIPDGTNTFKNTGSFCIWIETSTKRGGTPPEGKNTNNTHPSALPEDNLLDFFKALHLNEKAVAALKKSQTKYFFLPSLGKEPLTSHEMATYLGNEIPVTFKWKQWLVPCITTSIPLAFLKEIHFFDLQGHEKLKMGSDLLYWYHYGRAIREIILRDQYIPALKAQRSKKQIDYESTWQIISPRYQSLLEEYEQTMPVSCRAGQALKNSQVQFYEPKPLLKHFSEQLIDDLVSGTPITQQIASSVKDTLVEQCLPVVSRWHHKPFLRNNQLHQRFTEWFQWKKQLESSHADTSFILGFRLDSADEENSDQWQMRFLVESRKDPSLKVELFQYWSMQGQSINDFRIFFGKDFEKNFLIQMGAASRIYPKLWNGLQTEQPHGMVLSFTEAFDFLQEDAWVLEDAGYRIIVPAWWTPEGRRRAKLRMKLKGVSPPKQQMATGFFTLPSLAQYDFRFSIGDEAITDEEWKALVDAKSPLVHFRGEWMMLDQDKMAQMLSFWESEHEDQPQIEILDLIKKTAEDNEDIDFEMDDVLSQMMLHLRQKSQFEITKAPKTFQGDLRDYQNRGLSWLTYLETLGMGSCLADDMGLGKTIQIIALLLKERQYKNKLLPTLMIAPTSVLGNWQKEIERFGPTLKSMIHHGSQRLDQLTSFEKKCSKVDIVITSFALIRRDAELFNGAIWHRIVIDEAQNIKNPKSAQTRSILKLKAKHRIALTGTPIENRLLDLWSILNFLNPGYLGTQTQFRSAYELPIQKENDSGALKVLRQLVEPFILRRVKTDKEIIQDLPDKVEQKVYCTLSKEQASLYQTVVDEVQDALDGVEGIQRKGMILSTLMKLKQICNHPAQFLKDGSEFTEKRSHKMGRVVEMIEEVLENKESLLIFTQFTEVGTELEKFFHSKHFKTWYLHGGTTRKKRESMIAEFQDSDTPPGIFILSLKAGGVGITLTKANHVFHFDRWWNPAVENQATDRAFRIGQEKNVFVHKFVATGTLEERIDNLLEDKQKLSDSIVGSDESWLTELDDESFKELIELNRNTIIE